jgi:murein DD-endopeptidase MepM/ murein hydrolase activator NlpD
LDIVSFPANRLLADASGLRPGSIILVPGGRLLQGTPTASPVARPTSPGWRWPVDRLEVIARFGPLHPEGIDIAAPMGAPVYAANAGTVVFVGGEVCCGAGRHVIVDHGGGFESLYGHFGAVNVNPGDTVEPGDLLGWVGRTGDTEGHDQPFLHFEVRREGFPQDPLAFLP